ncbi:HAD-IB family hydrolase, partial [Clostridium botulinum]|nr:HAD-IB family hydrolase [Clostridium botulinum]
FRGAQYVLDKESIYTGDVIPMWDSDSKRKAINELVEKYDIDLKKSYAYGDTSGDFSMFKMVENPICVNPTKELIQKVVENEDVKEKTKIIVERKDMVYKLTPESINLW